MCIYVTIYIHIRHNIHVFTAYIYMCVYTCTRAIHICIYVYTAQLLRTELILHLRHISLRDRFHSVYVRLHTCK